jgi:hypothetical protein
VIENEAANLKGFAIDLSCRQGGEIVQIVPAAALIGKNSNHFFGTIDRELGGKTICLAALGVDRSFRYTGEIARLTVSKGTGTGTQLTIEKADLRDLENHSEEVTVTGGVGQTPFVPTKTALFQNQPNPFNPSTTIKYDVPAGGIQVTLRIYDIRGTLIRTLVGGTPSGGRYTAQWDGRDNGGQRVSSGIYFYQLKAGGFVETRKMLLMK